MLPTLHRILTYLPPLPKAVEVRNHDQNHMFSLSVIGPSGVCRGDPAVEGHEDIGL